MARIEIGGPKPGKSQTEQATYDTFRYCGDTRRTSKSEADDEGVIVVVENLDTEKDGASSEYVYYEDLED